MKIRRTQVIFVFAVLISSILLFSGWGCEQDERGGTQTPSVPQQPTTAADPFRFVTVTGKAAEFDEICAWTAIGAITINFPRAGEYLITAQLAMGTWHAVVRIYPTDGAIITLTFDPTTPTDLAPIMVEADLRTGTIVAPQQTKAVPQVVQEREYPADQTWRIVGGWGTVFAWPNGGIGSWDRIFQADQSLPAALVTNMIPHACYVPTPTPTPNSTKPKPTPAPFLTTSVAVTSLGGSEADLVEFYVEEPDASRASLYIESGAVGSLSHDGTTAVINRTTLSPLTIAVAPGTPQTGPYVVNVRNDWNLAGLGACPFDPVAVSLIVTTQLTTQTFACTIPCDQVLSVEVTFPAGTITLDPLADTLGWCS